MPEARFVVGIDLGTTHTVVAFAPLAEPGSGGSHGEVEVFPVPQLVTPTTSEPRPLLPSTLYAPLAAEQVVDPWGEAPWVTGELARRRGVEVPGRLVASAKSWLSHAAVDRTAPILPWGGGAGDLGDAGPKVSPCDASAAVLGHVRRAWDAAHPDAPLSTQDVILTVPASFDEVARELTVAAATSAGLTVRLLEEPQAAFYDYRRREGDGALAGLLAPGVGAALVLVCDVGGGTTDLSLVRVAKAAAPSGGLEVSRVAVGRHLLLGGDNMDLALAHLCEARLSETPLDPARYGQLVLACRAAKEALLADGAPPDVGVSVAAAGSRLVGGTRSTRVTRDEVLSLALDGFFPRIAVDDAPAAPRSGLLGFGLPYERDLAITRHVAAFFARHSDGAPAPSALLLNGGVFHAPAIAARLASAIDAWGTSPVPVLPHADPDLAVARGAVTYGLARRGAGARIGSGSSRGYYVAVASAGSGVGPAGEEAASASRGRAVVCVVPRGAEEGTVQVAAVAGGAPLSLIVGRPARFELFASDNATGHRAGDVIRWGDVELDALPAVYTAFEEKLRGEELVKVALQGELTATGTLDLACVELEAPALRTPRRFRLAFDLRRKVERPSVAPPTRGRGARQEEEAVAAVDRVFGKASLASPREVKDLVRELERLLGDRGAWDARVARSLFDAVARGAKGRRRSADHERVFWQLAGFCLRPGVGDPGDPARVDLLFRLLPEKLAFPAEMRGWQQFWFAWRRVAAGLDEKEQGALRDLVDPFLAPKEAGKKLPKWKPEAPDALLEMASSLERLPGARRADLGAWVTERTWTDRDPRLWAAVGRIGARVPAYASASHVVPVATVERWLDQLLREKWGEVPSAAEAAMQMARVTGDRTRDVPERMRLEIARRLRATGVAPDRVRVVEEVVEAAEGERVAALVGEGMPLGLRLTPG